MENLLEDYMAARCTIKHLKQTIDEFQSGERYLKLQKDYHRVAAGYIKEIKRLRKEVGELHAGMISIRNMWSDDYYALYDESQAEIRQLKETIRRLYDKIWEKERGSDEKITKLTKEYEDKLYQKDCVIAELQNKLAHAHALLSQDGTNAGIPTSRTPCSKKKRIPNTREKTGKKKGGQPGHEKHVLAAPSDGEITDTVIHGSGDEGFLCPACDGEHYIPTGESEVKYEYDVEISIKKIRHVFYCYKCLDCGTEFRSVYPPQLRGDVQYGPGLQALALSLTNTVNAAMNKTAMFLNGLTQGELSPCEGYVAKLQGRAAKWLRQFREDLKRVLITLRIVYWDDTVIMILTKRACLRFYGDERIAYYTAHTHKDMESLDDDNVLNLLTEDTKAMHDHNTVNYNSKYHFENIECNQHLQRDCQKNTDNTCHKWSRGLKEFIGHTIKERNDVIAGGGNGFDQAYIDRFHEKVDKYLSDGWKENEADAQKYGAAWERTLLRRIEEYRHNYFLWVEDFSIPTTNNLSERGLRGVKSHMKISGQFESEAAADNHALIRTYIETCRRNGINEIMALQRLCSGNPYTVAEIFPESSP